MKNSDSAFICLLESDLSSKIAVTPKASLPPGTDEFLSRLDGMLSRRNERISQRLVAWGEVLDLAGWCVAVERVREEPWLNGLAKDHLEHLDKTAATWRDLLKFVDALPDEDVQRKSVGLLIWVVASPQKSGVRSNVPLTRRESEVMAWLRQGKTSPEIAIILGCSARTIEKHVTNLYRKLGVRDRADVILGNF